MKKLKIYLIGFVFALTAVLSMGSAAQAEGAFDSNEHLKELLQEHEAQISQDLFRNKGYRIGSVKFKGSLVADLELENKELPTEAVVAAQQQSTNEGTTDMKRVFTFNETREKSFEITNSKTISTGGEATVSASIPFTSADVESTFSFNVDTSKSRTDGTMESRTWEDVTEYVVEPGHRATAQFIIEESQAKKIRYTGRIKLSGSAEVTMVPHREYGGKFTGKVSLYEHMHYGGDENWFHIDDDVAHTSGYNDQISSIKIEGPVKITVYEHMHFGGKSKEFDKSTPHLSGGWNDMISSFKVRGVPQTKIITIDKYLTADQRSIEIEGGLKAAQGITSRVKITSEPITGTEAEADDGDAVENLEVIPGGKIISQKLHTDDAEPPAGENVVSKRIGEKAHTVNGVEKQSDVAPHVKDEHVFVPLRSAAEGLGAEVEFVKATNEVRVTHDDLDVSKQIGQQTATVNGVEKQLEVPSHVKDGRTMVPLNFFSEALGAETAFDSSTNEVHVRAVDRGKPEPQIETNMGCNGRLFGLQVGQDLTVSLESNPTTCYVWKVAEIEESILKQKGEAKFQELPSKSEPIVGAPGVQTFRFEAVGAGETTLGLAKYCPAGEPVETFSIRVVVR